MSKKKTPTADIAALAKNLPRDEMVGKQIVFAGPGVNILDLIALQFPDGMYIGHNSFQSQAVKRVGKLNKRHAQRRLRKVDGKAKDKGVDPREP